MLQRIKKAISYNLFFSALNAIYRNYFQVRRSKFGFIDKTSRVRYPILIKGIENVFMHENTHIMGHSILITTKAKFVMKKNSASAERLMVVTGNHPAVPGKLFVDIAADDVQDARDVVVEEDVWLAANVTLLSGCQVGRGAIIGNGAVCRGRIPPYAIVIGNPAKVIGFRFTPEEAETHEASLYPKPDRIDGANFKSNYEKYFLRRASELKSYINP